MPDTYSPSTPGSEDSEDLERWHFWRSEFIEDQISELYRQWHSEGVALLNQINSEIREQEIQRSSLSLQDSTDCQNKDQPTADQAPAGEASTVSYIQWHLFSF
jgi:hypothetical protein